MAYAAVISLKQTIERSRLGTSCTKILEYLYDEVSALQEVLKEFDSSSRAISREKVNDLDGQIRGAVWELEDVIESHCPNQFLSLFDEEISPGEEDDPPFLFLEELKQDIDSFIRTVDNLKKAYVHELQNPSHEEEEEEEDEKDEFVHSRPDESKIRMVGLSDQFKKVKNWLTNKLPRGPTPRHLKRTLALFGTAGIGKTALALKLFQDPSISSHFDRSLFVTVGPKYQLKRVLIDILKQVKNPDDIDEEIMLMKEEIMIDALKELMHRSLDDDKRYLMVLDDIWDNDVWFGLIHHFPDDNRGSRILITTRLREVAHTANADVDCEVRFLDKKESWDLLREKVFGEQESLPYELEKAGKKIAEKCEGLPLTIITVAKILSKSDKTTEYWNKVAAEKQNSVFMDAYEKMSKVLHPSYEYLPQYLKACFLYMGVFPQNYEIPYSKLVNLWRAEGFLSYVDETTNEYFAVKHLFEYFAVKCLFELISKSLVMIHKQSYSNGMKTFSLHSPFWYLCNKEAMKRKFFYALNTLADALAEEGTEGHRRLCVRNNVLFAIKDVYDWVESTSTVRSLLCTGPYHPYPVPVCSSLSLLKILDALTIRFYEFSMEVVTLVQLTYLALTFNGNLPSSISNLWNLEYLIVRRHLSIIGFGGNYSSYLPMEIWRMQELKHVHVMGSDLPDPPTEEEESLLPNLLSLLDVTPQSCTKDVFERTPNLQKLGIRIQLSINDDEPFSFFDHISHLHKLEKLKCAIVNPKIMLSGVVAPPVPLSIFPPSLVKLTLSGLGYPWEEMSKISSLPSLRVLKLRCHAFRGAKWVTRREEFPNLEFLLIEDSDIVEWSFKKKKKDIVEWTFPDIMGLEALRSLSLKHCYKLERIPLRIGMVKKIELVDCKPLSPSYPEWFKRFNYNLLHFNVHSSWE
ncbi:hypothetical protein MIMGU_mgv1a025613mg [Erythranthe guttata]|uniref:Uncharacterized protein n=1 Tax=Erythranthe guttata TaxID=4155 RepID=A0A022PPP8_ERYGU|nr:hypothetical protein MIMGU_mgv1a025613mg [Erythranthe guttata]